MTLPFGVLKPPKGQVRGGGSYMEAGIVNPQTPRLNPRLVKTSTLLPTLHQAHLAPCQIMRSKLEGGWSFLNEGVPPLRLGSFMLWLWPSGDAPPMPHPLFGSDCPKNLLIKISSVCFGQKNPLDFLSFTIDDFLDSLILF